MLEINFISLIAAIAAVLLFAGLSFFLGFWLLGIRRYYRHAEEPTLERMREATRSYLWLGTSAHYVIGHAKIQDLIRQEKKHVRIRFVTIDPECDDIVAKHAKWQGALTGDIKQRIEASKSAIESLRDNDQCNIGWMGQAQLPVFRVVVIDDAKILVSFYERGRTGPESKQFELKADSLLGRWFKGYFEKSWWMTEEYMKNRGDSG